MAGKARLLVIKIFVSINILVTIVFLLACLAPYIDPQKWWFISLLSLVFIILLILQFLFIFLWLFLKPRYSLISFLSLLIGWKSIAVVFALHFTQPFNYHKPKNALRVATWNVARFVEWRRNNNAGSQTRLKMMEMIKEQDPDILCMQEFFTSTDSIYYNNIKYIQSKLNYPYYYFSWDEDGYLQWNGQVIFSKYPIIDSGAVHYPRPTMPESLIHADIVFNGDTIRIYTTHLQSVKFKKEDYERIEKIKNRGDSMLQNSRSVFTKLKTGVMYRAAQAHIAKAALEESPYPYLLCGDFNDVPNSYAYFTIRSGLQDAFLEKGFGIGRTFTGISPTLRIDYILTTPQIAIQQFNRVEKILSDHYMLITDIQLKTGKGDGR